MSSATLRISRVDIDGKAMSSSLDGGDVQDLMKKPAIASNPVIVLSGAGAGASYTLTPSDIQQSLTDSQGVSMSGLGAAGNIYVGADAASVASSYIQMFNLTTTSFAYRALLRFKVAQAAGNGANAVSLANTSGTSSFVQIKLANSASASTQSLFANNAAAGLVASVEVWASSLTSGSQAVVFNIVAGY